MASCQEGFFFGSALVFYCRKVKVLLYQLQVLNALLEKQVYNTSAQV